MDSSSPAEQPPNVAAPADAADEGPSKAAVPRQRRRSSRRRWLRIGAVLLVLGVAGFFAAGRFVPVVRERRLLSRAQEALQKNDVTAAAMSARRLLQVQPHHPGALRVMVEATERLHHPSALNWKTELVAAEPTLDNRLSLAETALALSNAPAAEAALLPAAEAGEKSARYQELAGRTAGALFKQEDAVAHFAAAVQLEPGNQRFQFHLAVAQLTARDPATRQQGRAALETLSAQPEFLVPATEQLVDVALQRGEKEQAAVLAERLRPAEGAAFGARLIYLDALHRTKAAKYPAYLTDLQEASASRPEDAAALLSWMNEHDAPLVAFDWGKSLPAATRDQLLVRITLADSCALLRKWPELKVLIQPQASAEPAPVPAAKADPKAPAAPRQPWGAYEFKRLAYTAAIMRAEGKLDNARTTWNLALQAADNRSQATALLARFASMWGWEEGTDALWKAAKESTNQLWALKLLYREYERSNSALGMYRVLAETRQRTPNDPSVQNNYAALALLLRQNVPGAMKVAEEVYARDPLNPTYATTYAYGKFVSGQPAEALAAMRKLSPKQLEIPEVAAYYAVFLANEGEWQEALRYLQLAKPAKLLPEEAKLLERAEAQARWKAEQAGKEK